MKIKTLELIGKPLDWAVAKCKDQEIHWDDYEEAFVYHDREEDGERTWAPSTDWAQGGPLIEREKITTVWTPLSNHWSAYWAQRTTEDWENRKANGPTLLIAAMRCYVASKFGDEIEIPDELL
jgi:hypothetical protein